MPISFTTVYDKEKLNQASIFGNEESVIKIVAVFFFQWATNQLSDWLLQL